MECLLVLIVFVFLNLPTFLWTFIFATAIGADSQSAPENQYIAMQDEAI